MLAFLISSKFCSNKNAIYEWWRVKVQLKPQTTSVPRSLHFVLKQSPLHSKTTFQNQRPCHQTPRIDNNTTTQPNQPHSCGC